MDITIQQQITVMVLQCQDGTLQRMNIHRTILRRNFEYFSEDGILSVKSLLKSLLVHKKRCYSYIKHYFLNDQESDRTAGLATWADEQTMREIYAKPFEIAIKAANRAAKANGSQSLVAVMSAFNRIGEQWVGGSYTAMMGLLRNEWGFKNHVITDYYQGNYMVQELGVLAAVTIRC